MRIAEGTVYSDLIGAKEKIFTLMKGKRWGYGECYFND